jgi:UDP-glucuronate decarboxylase
LKIQEKDIDIICEELKTISHMFSGKKIILTGGQGFLGQYVCATLNKLNEQYLSQPCEVIVVDNFFISDSKKLPDYNHFSYMDCSVEEILSFHKLDYIMFLAGIASPHYYIKYPLETINIVSIGLANYLKIAEKNDAKLLFASSSEIYGTPDINNIPTKETYNGNVSTLSDRSCYDESKRLGETLCYVYSKQNVNVTIIRPFNFYGPLMISTDYRVLPNFANSIFNGLPVQLYGDGSQTRTFCYITDGIAGMFRTLLLGRSGQAYNIGNPYPEISMTELLTLCQTICEENDLQHPSLNIKLIENPTDYPVNGDPSRRCPDIYKAEAELQYYPQVSLKQGLTQFLTWAYKNYK